MRKQTTHSTAANTRTNGLQPETPGVGSAATYAETQESPLHVPPLRRSRRRRRFAFWREGMLIMAVFLATVLLSQWYGPKSVTVIQPTLVTITESLSATGRVVGATETVVGTQAAGVVHRLFVREGEQVQAGQQLAILKHDVAEAQVAQAQAALNTARAQVAQVARASLSSEIAAATEQVQQARAQIDQQRAAVLQARQLAVQAQALLSQLEAERDLAVKQYERSTQLAERGFISQAEFEQAQAGARVAQEKVRAQVEMMGVFQANVHAAQAGVEAAQANMRAQTARLQTIQRGPRPEDIQVAQERVEEAEHALRVARQQAATAIVTAPFAGIVTAVHVEVGRTVGAEGVLQLVSSETEIRLEVDESHLADLAIGQATILSSGTFQDSTFQGKVSKIAAAVDAVRGTVTVTIVPSAPPDWLRPGQTVNVNILTRPAVQRLLVPATAVTRVGERTGVLLVEQGRALHKAVLTRPPTTQGVPILSGLTTHDRVIANAQGVKPGETVSIRNAGSEGQP